MATRRTQDVVEVTMTDHRVVRRIGEGGLFAKRIPTLPFNGYGDQVASLYAGMDLRQNF